jgi:outer membrane protein insertion porin family
MRIIALKKGLLRTTSVCLSLAMAVTPVAAQIPAVPAVPGAAPTSAPVSTPAAAAPVAQPTVAPAPGVSARVIRRLEVLGTQRIENATVLTYVNMREGDLYNEQESDVALKALFATGLFTAATRMVFDPATGTLTIRVTENPIVNQVVFEGNSKISSKDLTKETQIKPRAVFTRAKVQADVTRIMELYRRNGRFASRVEPQIISRPQNRVDLIFSITEGDNTGVNRINFIGNRIFDDATLRGTIATEESAWWKILSTSDNYDPDRLAYDRELLRRYYVARGYADFKVSSSVAQLTPGAESFFITFTIDEGPRYRLGKVEVDSKIVELPPGQLTPLLRMVPGDWYNSERIQQGLDALTNAAGTRGYAFAQVSPEIKRNPEARTIDVSFNVAQGPRVYIERIDIAGNTRTLDRVVRREFRLVEGDAFNRVMLDRSQQRIRALGFFKDVQVRNTPGSQPDRTNVTVSVTEQSTGSIAIGVGYSSYSSLIGDISYTETNLFGRGQSLAAVARMSYVQKQFQLSFTEPWFLDRPLAAGIDLQKVVTDYTQAAFSGDTTAAILRLGFPVSEFSLVSLNYMYKIQKINVNGSAPLEILLSDGNQNGSVIGYAYSFNDVDDYRTPTSGGTFSFAQNFAGFGGSLKYLESQASMAAYTPLPLGLVGSLSFRAKYITGYDGTAVPVNSRYFEGGDSFRGFAIAGVGPRDISQSEQISALGGNVSAIGTFNLSMPSLFPESMGVKVALFADFGTVGHLDNTAGRTCTVTNCVRDNLAFRASTGLSIEWQSPFGPLQIDLGIPLVKAPYDREQIIHLRTGTGL